MYNQNYEVGSHIAIQGRKGIVEEIYKTRQCKYYFDGKKCGIQNFSNQQIQEMAERGYKFQETGRTHTTFTVKFLDKDLIKTPYNHGHYGCWDDVEHFGKW